MKTLAINLGIAMILACCMCLWLSLELVAERLDHTSSKLDAELVAIETELSVILQEEMNEALFNTGFLCGAGFVLDEFYIDLTPEMSARYIIEAQSFYTAVMDNAENYEEATVLEPGYIEKE